ncbi:MAG: SUMF1/EgtB/PvdO family nonheme iron enzyme [Calditrichia bacterium]|nr:SUMF1/EgtB/PvdO family nonheme iron enzyme [Calditrichia bacterium]
MKNSSFIFLIIIIFIMVSCGQNTTSTKDLQVKFINTGVNPDTWVLIPAGEFYKGLHNHETMIEYEYEIMQTDVTNAQYVKYLNSALELGKIKIVNNKVMGYYHGEKFDNFKHEFKIAAGDWLHLPLDEPGMRIIFKVNTFSVLPGFENHPVTNITWFGAKAYCDFNGYRLPTEEEWEKAARGNDKRSFPWGDEIYPNITNYYSSSNVIAKLFAKKVYTTPVGYYNGKSYAGFETKNGANHYGLYDMAGNVWQWMGDVREHTHLRYMRGGSRTDHTPNLRIWTSNSAGPDYASPSVGFRCVRTPEQE